MLAVIATVWVVVVLVAIAVAANREKIIEIDKWERALHTLERLGDEPVEDMEVTTQRQLAEPNVKVIDTRPALPQQREPAHDRQPEPAGATATTATAGEASGADEDEPAARQPVPAQEAPPGAKDDAVTSKPEQPRAA